MNTWKIVAAALVIYTAGIVTGRFVSSSRDRRPTWTSARENTRVERNTDPGRHRTDVPSGAIRPGGGPPGMNNGRPPGEGSPPGWQRFQMIDRWVSEAALTSEQRDRMRLIVQETRSRIRDRWDPIAPVIRDEIKQLHRRLAEELSPEQRRQLEEAIRPIGKPGGRLGGSLGETPRESREGNPPKEPREPREPRFRPDGK